MADKVIEVKRFDNWPKAERAYDKLYKKHKGTDNLVSISAAMKDDGMYHVTVYQHIPNEKKVFKIDSQRSFDVITDSTEVLAPFDGKVYTSKAAMRAEANARGLVELGNENVDRIQGERRAEIQREMQADTRRDVKEALQRMGHL